MPGRMESSHQIDHPLVIIPACNEAGRIEPVLDGLHALRRGLDIVVIDDIALSGRRREDTALEGRNEEMTAESPNDTTEPLAGRWKDGAALIGREGARDDADGAVMVR